MKKPSTFSGSHRVHSPRPAESLTVKSMVELKRKIKKIRYITGASYCKYIRKSHVFDLLNSFEAGLRDDLFGVFDGKIKWDFQCPPERRGAEIALIRVLAGKSWEDANKASFAITKSELLKILGDGGGSD